MIDPVLDASERRIVLVDGFNVLHAGLLTRSSPSSPSREGDADRRESEAWTKVEHERETAWWRRDLRERLLRRVARWVDRDDEIWVAFDGADPGWSVWAEPVAIDGRDPRLAVDRGCSRGEQGGPIVHALFAPSADDWIVRRARRARVPGRTLVVSSDRKVAGRARSAGCEVWSPRQFLLECPDSGPSA